MDPKELPSPEVLRQLLRYEPETGKLYWRERPAAFFKGEANVSPQSAANRWNGRYAHRESATTSHKGYPQVRIQWAGFSAHSVIWAMHYGEWPSLHIDHINGQRDDNRIVNLRLATRSQNNQNVRSQRGSSSRFKGVAWDKSRGKWTVGIKVNYKRHNLGRFDCEIAAAKAHDAAALRLYGAYAKLNFPVVDVNGGGLPAPARAVGDALDV